MQTATSETESRSRDLSICVHHYIATLSPQPVQRCRRLAAHRPRGRRGALPRCLRVDMQPPPVLPQQLSLLSSLPP